MVWRYTHTHTILFMHLLVDGHLVCFHLLAVMNICVKGFVWAYFSSSLGYIPRSDTAGSYNNSAFSF